MAKFHEGMKLGVVRGPTDINGECFYVSVERGDCKSITVTMEAGMYCGIAWAIIERDGKPNELVNLMMMEEVEEVKP